MECLITLCHPAWPPLPTTSYRLPPNGKSQYFTYAGHLEQEYYAYVDRDIIALTQRLQAHYPAERPKLHELDEWITSMIARKGTCDGTQQELEQWMQRILYEPPPDVFVDKRLQRVVKEVIGTGPINQLPVSQFPRTFFVPYL